MTFVVTDACINCKYGECARVCPQDAFHEGFNFVVINPDSCSNCGLCEMVCPVDAIFAIYNLPDHLSMFININMEQSKLWPKSKSIAPLDSADDWAKINDKVSFLKF